MNKYEKYDNFWRRFFALIIDYYIITFFLDFAKQLQNYDSIYILESISFIIELFPFIYPILMTYKFGQTIGKMIMGIKVVDYKSECNITMRQSFLREAIPFTLIIITGIFIYVIFAGEDLINFRLTGLGYFIILLPSFTLIGWYILEIFTMLTDLKKRAVHDKIAGTVVIRKQNTKDMSAANIS